jgi:hypothetical protein
MKFFNTNTFLIAPLESSNSSCTAEFISSSDMLIYKKVIDSGIINLNETGHVYKSFFSMTL